MNILIIETVWMGGTSYRLLQKTVLTVFSILPTLQARELAAITPKHHRVTLINERYTTIPFDGDFDVVLLNFVTSTAPRAYVIADTFRKKGISVVLCGFHASGLPEEAKQHADSVLIGRNEHGWLTVLQDLEHKHLEPFYHAPIYTPTEKLPASQVSLPGFTIIGALEATRGCPYQCAFCPETNIEGGRTFFKRPISEVIAEIQTIPQKILMFYDTSLTVDPSYAKELFKNMKGLHKKFLCNGNADILAHDPELVRLSKEAGCAAWLIGFESVYQTTLDMVGKKTNTVVDYAQAVRNIHSNRMAVIGDFIFGFDTDTPEVFEKTLSVIKDLDIDVADFSILTPFPGTPLFEDLIKQNRILTKEWKLYNMGHAVYQPSQMTPEQLEQGIQWISNEFYTIPTTIRRTMRSLHGGCFIFFVVFLRNLVAMMNRRRLFK
jgi:radical SAM superfamily enzyme YgiQ (UPF0313 family)